MLQVVLLLLHLERHHRPLNLLGDIKALEGYFVVQTTLEVCLHVGDEDLVVGALRPAYAGAYGAQVQLHNL